MVISNLEGEKEGFLYLLLCDSLLFKILITPCFIYFHLWIITKTLTMLIIIYMKKNYSNKISIMLLFDIMITIIF